MTTNKSFSLASILGAVLLTTLTAPAQRSLDSIARKVDRSLDSRLAVYSSGKTSVASLANDVIQFNSPALDNATNATSRWSFSASSETSGIYDNNALGSSSGRVHDWLLSEEATIVATWQGSERFSISAVGAYSGARYKTYSSEDFDAFSPGASMAYKFRKATTIKLSDVQTWALERGLDSTIFTRNRVNLGISEDLGSELLMDPRWTLTVTPTIRRDSYEGPGENRTRVATSLEIGRELTEKLTTTIGLTTGYTWKDHSGHFLETEVTGELGYQLNSVISVSLRVYYLNHSITDIAKTFNQWNFSPVLGLSAKF